MANPVGSIGWVDLTVPDAGVVKDFYQAVVGWGVQPCDMGGYEDFSMLQPADGKGVSGICHARGGNKDLPPVWMIYIIVEDVEASAAKVVELGGKVLAGPKSMGQAKYCVIQDPAGAACALYQP
jgi:predicted enzyme related to lactoylglutathione lyase